MHRTRIFDTNVYSTFKNKLKPKDTFNSALSIICFYELTATPINRKRRKIYTVLLKNYQDFDALITPTENDWRVCSQAIWQMHENKEAVPKDATALQNDVLICQSAISWYLADETRPPCVIVTENTRDFDLIAAYLNERLDKDMPKLLVVRASAYFS